MIAELQQVIGNTPSRPLREERLTNADRLKIKVERRAMLLRGAPTAICVSAVNAVITLIVAWGSVDPVWISTWAAAVIFLSAARLGLWRWFSKKSKHSHALMRFTDIHVAAMGANGVLWGMLAPILAFSGMLNHAFLPFIIAGMTAATISSAGASWKAVMAFNVPVLMAAALAYGVFEPQGGWAIALIIVLYGVATAFLAWRAQEGIIRAIRLRSRNDNLLKALTKQVEASHDAEQRYRALVEASSELTIIFTPTGKITYASPAVETTLGVPPQAIISGTTRDIVHPDDLEIFKAAGNKSLSKIGEVMVVDHVCMRGAGGGYYRLHGRLTNMLYVPGVEGFVFTGSLFENERGSHTHETNREAVS